uniref:Glutathione S-transferase n=1 Tax=Quercus lobata TaxID=97700 RepID=A0A7N2REP3_QUELO
MAVRKVYGSLNSQATLKVLACLFENDLDFEFVSVNLDAGEKKKKACLSMNFLVNTLNEFSVSNFCSVHWFIVVLLLFKYGTWNA